MHLEEVPVGIVEVEPPTAIVVVGLAELLPEGVRPLVEAEIPDWLGGVEQMPSSPSTALALFRIRGAASGVRRRGRAAGKRRIIQSVYGWCRRHRHLQIKVQHRALTRRIQGHFNYFAVSGNFRSLLLVFEQARRSWFEWLCRRSQRKRLAWERFADLLRDFPRPTPRIPVPIWGT